MNENLFPLNKNTIKKIKLSLENLTEVLIAALESLDFPLSSLFVSYIEDFELLIDQKNLSSIN